MGTDGNVHQFSGERSSVNVPSGSCEEIDERTPQDYCGKDEGPYPARVTNPPTSPTPRLISIDRQQILLRTVDVEKLIDEDHSARSVWELVGRLDLGLYHAQIEAVEGGAGRNHTDPQLLVSLWLYAYSRGISLAREVARQCEFEPGFQWLCGLQAISHRTLSGFRSENKAALDDLFVHVRAHPERRRGGEGDNRQSASGGTAASGEATGKSAGSGGA